MLPYVLVFFVSIACTFYANKMLKKEKKWYAYILIGISILSLSLLAGLRHASVGKDAQIYILPLMHYANKYSFFEFMSMKVEVEKIFMVLLYFFANVFKSYNVLLFTIELFIVSVFYFISVKEYKNINLIYLLIVFLLVFYNDTFSFMRQCIAYSFIFLSLYYLKKRKYPFTILYFVLGALFHYTAIVAILGYIIIIINDCNKISLNTKKIINIFIIVALIFIVIFFRQILNFFTNVINLIPQHYYNYYSSKYYKETMEISTSGVIFRITWIIMSVILMQTNKEKNIYKECLMFLIIDFAFYVVSFTVDPVLRMGLYFTYPALLVIISRTMENSMNIVLKKDKQKISNIVITTLSISMLLVFWIFNNVIHKENGNTYPYRLFNQTDILKEEKQ